jgi:hypothetical protein
MTFGALAGDGGALRRLLLYVGAVVVCTLLLAFGGPGDVLQNIAIGVLGAAIFELLKPLADYWGEVRLAIAANTRGRRTAPVRFSVAYLYRLKLDDKYLLVRGGRIADQFQPVGGVYKRLPEAGTTLSRLGVLDDNALSIDESSRDDLRVRVPGKNVLAFLRWYRSGEGREVETWREFHEELVRPGILTADRFPYLITRHVRQHQTSLQWSEHLQCWEILIADIIEPILRPEQEAELRDLMAADHDDVAWATEDLIRSRGFDRQLHGTEHTISDSSCWLL